MASNADLERAYYLNQLGLTSSDLSTTDLERLMFSSRGFNRNYSGRYVGGESYGSLTAPVPVLDTLYLGALELHVGGSFDLISHEVTVLAATSVARLGVYSTSLTTGLPENLVVEVGPVDQATAGIKDTAFAAPIILPAGIYWLAYVQQVAAATVRGHLNGPSKWFFHTSNPGASFGSGWTQAGVAGALPATIGALVASGVAIPRIFLRAV